jgi:hypothetical protein
VGDEHWSSDPPSFDALSNRLLIIQWHGRNENLARAAAGSEVNVLASTTARQSCRLARSTATPPPSDSPYTITSFVGTPFVSVSQP